MGALSPVAPASAAQHQVGRAAVKQAQQRLGLTPDGVAGPATRKAIRRFERSHGLPVDGRLDARVLKALGVGARTAKASAGAGGLSADEAEASTASPQLEAIAQCESGGNPRAISPDGQYRGKYQFSIATWRSLGGKGDPAAASEAEQDRRAAQLMASQGPSAWPNCS